MVSKEKKAWYKRWWMIVIYVIIVLRIVGSFVSAPETPTQDSQISIQDSQLSQQASSESKTEELEKEENKKKGIFDIFEKQTFDCEEIINEVTPDCYWALDFTKEEREYCKDKIAYRDQYNIPHTYTVVEATRLNINDGESGVFRSPYTKYEDLSTAYSCTKGNLNGAKLIWDESKEEWVMIQKPVDWAIESGDTSECETFEKESVKNYCYYQIALEKKDLQICENIVNLPGSLTPERCKSEISYVLIIDNADVEGCKLSEGYSSRRYCFQRIAVNIRNKEICQNIIDLKDEFEDNYAGNMEKDRDTCIKKVLCEGLRDLKPKSTFEQCEALASYSTREEIEGHVQNQIDWINKRNSL